MMAGDLPTVARTALTGGDVRLSAFATQLFRPMHPMLAGSADAAEVAMDELGEALLEYKLDGARIQVHKAGERGCGLFPPAERRYRRGARAGGSRSSACPPGSSSWTGRSSRSGPTAHLYPFQITMSRFGRKLDIERLRRELPLTPFFFDLLYADGGALIDQASARTRLATLIARSSLPQ